MNIGQKHAWAALALVWSCVAGAVGSSGLGQLAQFDDLSLSSDGSKLIMVRASGEFYDVVVRNLDDGEEQTIYAGGGKNGLINWCRWGNAERVVCSVRHYLPAPRIGQILRTRMFAIDADGENYLILVRRARNKVRWPSVYNAQVQDRVVSWLDDDDDHILVQLNREDPNRPSVYKLNIYTNEMSRVQRSRSVVRRWYATHEGKVRLAVGYRKEEVPVVFHVDGRKLTEYQGSQYDSEIPPQPIGFSADERHVYMSMTNEGDRHGIYRVELATGRVVETLFRDPDFDVFGSVIMHPETGEPAGVSYVAHHPKIAWFDPRLAALFDRIKAMLPGSEMRMISTDFSYTRFIFKSYGGIAPRYYLYDRNEDTMTLIGKDFPQLLDENIVDLQPVRYLTRDGLPIPAYLAVPKGAGPHPTVLMPHGGPYARDSAEFDSWTQFLVELGFAVLKPNYRGSVGYGEAYMQAGYKEWGLKMQADLMDGLDWLVEQGITDAERVCIVGASYGGYTALVSAYKFADKISCAVSLAGISDLEETVTRLYDYDLVERNRSRIQASSQLKANSPIRQVESIDVPILLLHGNRDTVVRVKQSRQFASALAKHGKTFRYVEQDNGDHFLSLASQREEFFSEMGRFLVEHLVQDVR